MDESDADSENSASEGSAETRIHKYETITESKAVPGCSPVIGR